MAENPDRVVCADLDWQSMNNVCEDVDQKATPARRKSRKSWFETPPATKLDLAYEKKKRRSSGAGKRKSVENMETLRLTHFTNPPKISFGKIKVGKTRTRHLLIENPHDYEQDVVIEKFPFKKKFTLDSKTFTVPAEDRFVLTFTWTPEEDGNVREMVLFRVDGAYRLQAFLLGCADTPKPLKKQKKGLLGARVKRPFSILQTPGLACIRDNYSPQEAEKQPFIPGKYNPLQENVRIQNQENCGPATENRCQMFPPPALESTAISKDPNSSVCRSKVYNNMADVGCSPALPLTDFSPIPCVESENAHLVDSCMSIMQTSPSRPVTLKKENEFREDKTSLESQGENKVKPLDRKEIKDTETREIIQGIKKPHTPVMDILKESQPSEKKEFLSPDSFLNDSLSMQIIERKEVKEFAKRELVKKTRRSWTPQRRSPLRISDPDQSDKRFLSPDSFLNDSIVARQSGIGAATGTPFTETAKAFNHEEFEKSIVSPNSFLEELNSTRNDSLREPLFTCIASPVALTDADTHNIFMKQLRSQNVKTSHSRTTRTNTKAKTTHAVNFSSMTTKTTTVVQSKQSTLFAPTFASTRRATFVTKKSEKAQRVSAMPNAPSPRRATFLVSKKNNHGGKKCSPQLHHEATRVSKKLTRSQRFSDIHKADGVEVEKKSKARRKSKGGSDKKLKKTKTQAFIAAVAAESPEVVDEDADDVLEQELKECEDNSATVTKDKPFMVITDEKRNSKGRELFEEIEQNFATVTKTKLCDAFDQKIGTGKCLFAEEGVEDHRDVSATVTKSKSSFNVSNEKSGFGKSLFADVDTVEEIDKSATVTKSKSINVWSERSGTGKCLFAEEDVEEEKDVSATVTKGKSSFNISNERGASGKRLFDDLGVQLDNDQTSSSTNFDQEDGEKIKQMQSFEKMEFGSPSKMMKDVLVDEALVGRMSLTVVKERPSLSTIQESTYGDQTKTESLSDTPKASSFTSIGSMTARDSFANNLRRISGKKLFGADPMSPSKSPVLSSIFRDIGSPSRLPTSPDVDVSRRITLTVTKARPSDALRESTLAAEKDLQTSKTEAFVIAAKEETYVAVSESKEGYKRRKHASPTENTLNYNFKKVDTYEKVVNSAELKTLREQTSTWEITESPVGKVKSSSYTLTSPMFTVTPHAIPSSPTEENSRRSTHVISKPKVLETAAANPRRLFPPLGSEEQDKLVEGVLDGEGKNVPKSLDADGDRTSSLTSVSSVYSLDSLEAKQSISDVSSTSPVKLAGFPTTFSNNLESEITQESASEIVNDRTETSELNKSFVADVSEPKSEVITKDTVEDVSELNRSFSAEESEVPDQSKTERDEQEMDSVDAIVTETSESVSSELNKSFVDDTSEVKIISPTESQSIELTGSQTDVNLDESVFEKDENVENIPPSSNQVDIISETSLKPKIPEPRENLVLLKTSKTSNEADVDAKKRRKLRASKVSPISSRPGEPSPKDSSTQGLSKEPSPAVDAKKDNLFVAVDVAEQDKCTKTEVKCSTKKPVLSRLGSHVKRTLTSDKENVPKENTKKRPKSDPTEKTEAKKPGFLSRLTSTGKKTRPAGAGLAQSKLILVKKAKHSMPKHPMPFAAKNMYYDERWIEKQDRGFVHWLNFILTPPDEYNNPASKTKVDAGALNVDASKLPTRLAPTKEVLSIRAYTARRRLNRLRRAACMLYQSEALIAVIHKLEYEVEKRRISIRRDRMLHADIGIKQKILDMLLCYNPLWLRMGLETVFGEVLPLQSNSDVIGLSRFIFFRLLGNPDVAREYAHPTVPHLYRDGYAEATAKHALKKFLLMVFFLDQAKRARLIQHDPCLFCKDADIKSSKDMLIQFSRDYLSGEGDVTKHLAYMGYTVSHSQTALEEFDYAVTKLGVDLRDGLRLTRVLELLTGEWNLVKSLRAPAISRLQKVHNIEMVFKTLAERGLDVSKMNGGKVTTRDIVDGHREKTLKILWHLIFHFQVDVLINLEQLREEVSLLEQSLRVKVNMQRLLRIKQQENLARRDSGGLMSQENDRLELLLKWCRTVCLHYGVKVENFTVSFSDGRALCCLLHHYHPGLMPLSEVRLQTSQSYQQDLEDQEELQGDLDLSQDWSFQHPSGMASPGQFNELLANERENFKTLYEKVSELGGIPLMLKAADMSNTIPDEKVVVTYVSYLCGRLLDIRQESRAARVIQIAWRRFRLRTALREQHHEIKAARVIQTRVREFLNRKKIERQSRAALVLQAAWRGQRARAKVTLLKEAKMNAHLTKAVSKIQNAMQGYVAKKKFQRLRQATLKLQPFIRGYLARKQLARQQSAARTIQQKYKDRVLTRRQRTEFLNQRASAVTIQRSYRAAVARRNAHKVASAVTLQKAWRGYCCRKQLVNLRKSAVVVQSCVRMMQERRQYLKLRNSVISLQRQLRANKTSKLVREEFLEKKLAATTLQSQFRGLRQRKEYLKTKEATACIQKHFRGYKYRVKFQAMKLAATVIQRAYRLHKMAEDEKQAYLRRISSCVSIQRWWRKKRAEKLAKMSLAATVIQSAYRRHAAVKQFTAVRSSTLTIQRSLRAMLDRKRFLLMKAATVVLQHNVRQHLQKRQIQAEMQRKKNAIVRLQTQWRMIKAQRDYCKIKQAAITLQKNCRKLRAQAQYRKNQSAVRCLQHHVRCYLGRKRFQAEVKKQTSAALRIQTWWRMITVQKKHVVLRQKVVLLQAHIRCWSVQKMFLRQKAAAVIIQTRFRSAQVGKEARSRYRIMIRAAVTIQNALRSHMIRKFYLSMLTSAVRIQTWIRKIQAERRYQALKHASIILQRSYRAKKLTESVREGFVNTRSAAVTIQSAFRMRTCRKEFLRTKEATVVIQKYVRMHQQRARYCHQLQTLRTERSALVLQTTWRMIVVRRKFRLMKQAAICIKKWYKSVKLTRKTQRRFLIKKGAAITIQAVWRGYLARKHVRSLHCSATTIQTQYRAYKLNKQFKKVRNAVIFLQRLCRRRQEGCKQRQAFVEKRQATVKIQKTLRMVLVRRTYLRQRRAAVTIQRAFLCHKERKAFTQVKRSAVVCQRRFRATLSARQERNTFLQVRKSTITLQAAVRGWRARRLVQHVRSVIQVQAAVRTYLARRRYQQTLRSVVYLQACVRRNSERREFLSLKQAAVVLQQRWRATLVARAVRKDYFIQVGAAVTLQQGFRTFRIRRHYLQTLRQIRRVQACVRSFLVRRQLQQHQEAARIIQEHYRAQCKARKQRKDFLKMKSSACTLQTAVRTWRARKIARRNEAAVRIQSVVRMYSVRRSFRSTRQKIVLCQATVRGFLARSSYRNKLQAVSTIQKNIRTFLFCRNLRDMLQKRTKAATTIQAAYRNHRLNVVAQRVQAATTLQSNFRMCLQRKKFKQTCSAAILIQSRIRGFWTRRTYKQTLKRHRAATQLQSGFRGYRVRVYMKRIQAERQAQLELYTQRARCHLAAVRIQSWYRRCLLIRNARQRLASIILIQRRVRVFLQRLHYIKLRQNIVQLQRQCRLWLERRNRAATVLQLAFRRHLVQQRQQKLHRQVAKIQAVWRGYCTRRNIKSKKVNRARQRIKEASSKATDSRKLGNRTTSALGYLLNYKSVAQILEALMDLDTATRLSPLCCLRLADEHAAHVIYRIISGCNRSLPHMDLIKYCVNILLNLAKYDRTVESVHDLGSMEILVDLLVIYREKGPIIFSKTCCLLGILALDPCRRREMQSQTKVTEKIRSVHLLVSRRSKVQEQQNRVRAKMEATRSFNSTLPLPTPVKRKRVRPEWMLKRDSLTALQEPLQAINFLMENLRLSPK